jgi:uncharacterized protein (TIGR00369 family)
MKNKQATSKNCFVCGRENISGLHLDFYDTAPGETTSEITLGERFEGYPGVVHGGIVAAILDEVTGRVFLQGKATRFMLTARLEIRYRKPVPVGERLVVIGRAVRDAGRVAQATGQIQDCAGNILAEAEAYYVEPPKALVSGGDPVAWGWKVVPDEEVMS